jgi:hypothetical protein
MDMTGELTIGNLQEIKMYLGLNGTIFSHSYKTLGHLLEKSYCQWTWEFMDTCSMRLDNNIQDFKLYREGDGLLMDAFLRAGFRGKELKRLNECHLYLRVVCISEVLFGCGTKVDPACLRGDRQLTRNTYHWPNQGRPIQESWTLWKTAVMKSLNVVDNELTIEQPVLHWTSIPPWSKWFYDPYSERLYELEDGDWFQWIKAPFSVCKFHRRQVCRQAPVILDLEPATVQDQRAVKRMSGSARIIIELDSAGHDEWLDHLQDPRELAWLTGLVTTTDDGDTVAKAIRAGVAVAVSDGSFKDAFGTAAWVIQGETTEGEVLGRCSVPGPAEWQSAYRSELCGILGSVYCITNLVAKKGITTGKVRIGCDGLSAIQQVQNFRVTQSALRKHYDLISAIKTLIRNTPVDIEFFHVKGHQDDDATAALDRFALLNIRMDSSAKAHWTGGHEDEDFRLHEVIPGEGWPLWIGFEKITGEIRSAISNQVHCQPIE